MKRLPGFIPRGNLDHRTKEGKLYRQSIEDVLPETKRAAIYKNGGFLLMREYGNLNVDLERVNEEKKKALARRRMSDVHRCDRKLRVMRILQLKYAERLGRLAEQSSRVQTPEERIAAALANASAEVEA